MTQEEAMMQLNDDISNTKNSVYKTYSNVVNPGKPFNKMNFWGF